MVSFYSLTYIKCDKEPPIEIAYTQDICSLILPVLFVRAVGAEGNNMPPHPPHTHFFLEKKTNS